MKKIFFLSFMFFYCCMLQVYSQENMTEISCDTIQTITMIPNNKYLESYETIGFYIDDKNQELYFAPSGKECVNTSKIFTDSRISLHGVPYINGMGGSIEINRNSGTINMNFKNKNGRMTVIYTGRCKKVDKNNKF